MATRRIQIFTRLKPQTAKRMDEIQAERGLESRSEVFRYLLGKADRQIREIEETDL